MPSPSSLPVIEDVWSGEMHAIESDRFLIGGDPASDIVVAATPDEAVTLLVHGAGDIGCARGYHCVDLHDGETFEVGAHPFRIRHGRRPPLRRAPARYTIEGTLDGPTGPEVTVLDEGAGRSHAVRAPKRARLLHVLARRWQNDHDTGADDDTRWCTDDDAIAAVWGDADTDPKDLKALLESLWRELDQSGLDPWFLERRRGHVRVRVRGVDLH